jgi:hypothetical protein
VRTAVTDWAAGGNTNVDELGLACGPDNRSVDDGGWSTAMNDRCEVEWIPPPPLDTGQARLNTYHRPERLLHPPDEPKPQRHNSTVDGPEETEDVVVDGDRSGDEDSVGTTPDNGADEPSRPGSPGEPGGPAPPDHQAA